MFSTLYVISIRTTKSGKTLDVPDIFPQIALPQAHNTPKNKIDVQIYAANK